MAAFRLRRNSWAGAKSMALQEMHNSPSLSDVTICIADRRIHAHKVVLSMASDYFKSAFTGRFMESKSNELWLHDDDADAVEGMIRWIYDLKPSTTPHASQENLDMNLKLWTVGGKYQLPDLMGDAVRALREQLTAVHLRPNVIWADFKQHLQSLLNAGGNREEILEQVRCSGCRSTIYEPFVTPCLHVYCIQCYTGRYRWNGKCLECGTKHTSVVRCQIDMFDVEETIRSCSIQEFVSCIKAIYHSVPAHDGSLRTSVVALCRELMSSLMLEQDFLGVLTKTPELAVGMMKVVAKEHEDRMCVDSVPTLPRSASGSGNWGNRPGTGWEEPTSISDPSLRGNENLDEWASAGW